jgi:hypothetical protein
LNQLAWVKRVCCLTQNERNMQGLALMGVGASVSLALNDYFNKDIKMSLDVLLKSVSEHQRRIVQALLDNPSGLLSHELAEITGVSNKSETMKPALREWLKRCGLELVIERQQRRHRWSLQPYRK